MKSFLNPFKKIIFLTMFVYLGAGKGCECGNELKPQPLQSGQKNSSKKQSSSSHQKKTTGQRNKKTGGSENASSFQHEQITDLSEYFASDSSDRYQSEIKEWIEKNGEQKLKICADILENFIAESIYILIDDIKKNVENYVKDQIKVKGEISVESQEAIVKVKILKVYQQFKSKSLIIMNTSFKKDEIIDGTITIMLIRHLETLKNSRSQTPEFYKIEDLLFCILEIMCFFSKEDRSQVEVEEQLLLVQLLIGKVLSYVLESYKKSLQKILKNSGECNNPISLDSSSSEEALK